MRYLVAPVIALLCAVSTILPASAAPAPTTTITLTCDRGATAAVHVFLYADSSQANLLSYSRLSCGPGSKTHRLQVYVQSEPGWVGYGFEDSVCAGQAPVPGRFGCQVGDAPGATLSVR